MKMCIRSQTRRRSLIETSLDRYCSDDIGEAVTVKSEMSTSTEKQPRKKAPSSSKKREIQHNYHDHANDDGKVYMETPIVSKGGVTVPFPMKLHNMLEQIAQYENELEHIVSWQPHGRCFLVHKIKEFQEDVLPRFFQQRKYASFQRQLNLYGFSRLTKGPDRGAYYHELFLRGKSILCRGIYRMKVKGTGSRMASNPDQEPNFYSMTSMPSAVSAAPSSSLGVTEPFTHQKQTMEPLNLQQNTAFESMDTNSRPPETIPSNMNNNYESYFNSTPMNTASSSYNSNNSMSMYYEKVNENNTPEAAEKVFGDMQFHALEDVSRRHSLMMDPITRRLSMKFSSRGSFRNNRGSIVICGDNDFDEEMEMIAKLGDSSLSDNQLGDILDKIIDHRVIWDRFMKVCNNICNDRKQIE